MSDMENTTPEALIRVADHPPSEMPAVVLEDFVPFPGPVVPMLLDQGVRRRAVLHARHHGGYLLLINRARPAGEGERGAIIDEAAARLAALSEQPSSPPDAGLANDQNLLESAVAYDADDLAAETLASNLEVSMDTGEEAPAPITTLSELLELGVVAKIARVLSLPNGRLSVFLELRGRARPLDVVRARPFPVLRVLFPLESGSEEGDEVRAAYRQLRLKLQAFFEAHPSVSEDIKLAAMGIDKPGVIADFVAQHLARDYEERLAFLRELDVVKRVRRALEVAIRELDLLTIGNRIAQEIRDKVEKNQREYFLREQLRAIRRELGEEKDPTKLAVAELTAKLAAAGLPETARLRADEELKRLELVPVESPEHNVVRSYLDWIASLPWSKMSEDNPDLGRAKEVLDRDHFGLADVKERILEFLAVRQLNPSKAGSLLCFAGPPGVGKTSLGKSIAVALGRKFYRFSVGGMRDEAEIKGHRRTYIGAMPGKILQGLKQAGTANPVFMLDELDKIGNDWRGDPSSALLEVLDPAQNNAFNDHYLDLPFDLSRVMFIATVNIKTEVPDALRDRLEIIDLPGYIPEEKLEIAARYLLPRQLADAGLTPSKLGVSRGAIMSIVREYTHEAGVRELERQFARICRKRAAAVVSGERKKARVGIDNLPAYLGPPKVQQDRLTRRMSPGVVLGLAWTPVGGDVLFIEATVMPGKGLLKLTGQLGEVMSESANLALSYVRAHASELGIDPKVFTERDLHVHFPAGAVKKDGPSAGVTITTALISLLKDRKVRPRTAMTGEMTLRGEVLPVGGIREKVVAARRIGVGTVILPERNRADVDEIPSEVRKHVRFVYATTFADVLAAAL